MVRCECGSYAINHNEHGSRIGVYVELCDVCYWRRHYEDLLNSMMILHNETNKGLGDVRNH